MHLQTQLHWQTGSPSAVRRLWRVAVRQSEGVTTACASEPVPGPVLAIDGNSIVHRAFHSQAATGLRTADGRPIWAIRGLVGQLVEAVERLAPMQVVVGFDDPSSSVRRDRWPGYKAQRSAKPDSLVSQLALAVEMLGDLGVPVVVTPGLEADDLLAAVSTNATAVAHPAVLMTSDRDSFALINEHTSVLRILSGGVEASPLLTPQRLHLMLGIHPWQYLDYAALRGDASDNLPGVRGVGPKTAARLLARFGSARAMFNDVDQGGAAVANAIGRTISERLAEPAARAAWELNCQLMAPQAGVALPPDMGWPLAVASVRGVCELLQMPAGLPRALRVLADHHAPQQPDRVAWSRLPTTARGAAVPRVADRGHMRFPPLPRRNPVEQLALFST